MIDRDVHEGVAVEVEGDLVTGGKRYAPPGGGDDPLVGDGRTEEGHVAALFGGDGPHVDHRAGGIVFLEDIAPGIEVLVRKV